MARTRSAQSGDMEGDGDRVRARRERLGMSKAELAREAGVSRTTLAAVERDEGIQRSTLTKVERALAGLEEEAGIGAPPAPDAEAREYTFELEMPDGRIARVITKGTAPPERVAEQLQAILRRMSEGNGS